MGLTRAERDRLAGLADELALDNPRLARALAGRYYRLRPSRRTADSGRGIRDGHIKVFGSLVTLLALAAVAALIVGALLGQPLTIALGALVLLDAAALLAAVVVWRRIAPCPRASPTTRRHGQSRAT